MASSPPGPRIAAPKICLLGASTRIFMKPFVSPFSTARVGAALIAAREGKQDPFDAITAVIPWDRLRASVAEAGDYVWSRARQRTVNAEEYRLLRTASEAALPAAWGLGLSGYAPRIGR